MNIYRYSILIFFILGSTGCDLQNDHNPEYPPLSNPAQLIYNDLLKAYNESCISCLKSILDNWNLKYDPVLNVPDSINDVYKVFKEVYTPWDLSRMSESEWGDNIYNNVSYYIVQTTINYGFHFNEHIEETLTINDFKPSILNDTIKVLYYTNEYKSAISYFLGSDYVTVGYENSIENVIPVKPISVNEYLLRIEFLNNFLRVSDRNWIKLETHPEIFQISFSEENDSAKVLFNLIYENGEVILKKENNQWDIIEYSMLGIS